MAELTPTGLILTLLDPEYAPGTDIIKVVGENKHLLKPAVKLAERNGLYYFLMRTFKELNLDLPFESEKRWQEENRRLEELKKTIRLLNDVAEECGVKYIWIKSCNRIPHVPRDVDIFVRKEEEEAIAAALAGEGMRYDQPSKIQVLLEKKGLLRVDIYTELCYFTVDFLSADFLWSSVIEDEMFGIVYPDLNREVDFLLCLVHALFGHRSMSLLDFLHMKSLRDSIDVNTCKKVASENNWGSMFDLCLQEFDALRESIYEKGEPVRFPYIFKTSFVFHCASMIEGLHLNMLKKIALYISLSMDKLRASQRDTALYKLLRSFEPTRLLLNKIITIFRVMRGDRTA